MVYLNYELTLGLFNILKQQFPLDFRVVNFPFQPSCVIGFEFVCQFHILTKYR